MPISKMNILKKIIKNDNKILLAMCLLSMLLFAGCKSIQKKPSDDSVYQSNAAENDYDNDDNLPEESLSNDICSDCIDGNVFSKKYNRKNSNSCKNCSKNIIDSVFIKVKKDRDFQHVREKLSAIFNNVPGLEVRYRLGENLFPREGIYMILVLKHSIKPYFGNASIKYSYMKFGTANVFEKNIDVDEKPCDDLRQVYLKLDEFETKHRIAAWKVEIVEKSSGELIGHKESYTWKYFAASKKI